MQEPQTKHQTEAAADALMALHRRTVDALTGYATMVEKAEPSFRHVAEDFRSLHARHADQLARMLSQIGREADHDGSLMGTVNVAVVTLRALFDEIDADVMRNIQDGEAHVLEAFDAALATLVAPAMAADLKEMRNEVTALLQRHAKG